MKRKVAPKKENFIIKSLTHKQCCFITSMAKKEVTELSNVILMMKKRETPETEPELIESRQKLISRRESALEFSKWPEQSEIPESQTHKNKA